MSAFCSMFSQLLKLFPRTEFQALVKRTHAERHARGFTCWGQFVAMLFCQLGRAHSLREICGGLRSSEGKLKHLGIAAPSRSTLAYANEHRPWQLYRAVFEALLAALPAPGAGPAEVPLQEQAGQSGLDRDRPVRDALRLGPVPAHQGRGQAPLLLDHDGYLPSVVVITEGKRHDVRVARTLRFAPGTIVVMDRGYTDYALVRPADGPGGVVRHPPEGRRGLRGGRGPPDPGAGPRGARPGHPPDRRGRGGEVPARAAPGRGVRPGARTRRWSS